MRRIKSLIATVVATVMAMTMLPGAAVADPADPSGSGGQASIQLRLPPGYWPPSEIDEPSLAGVQARLVSVDSSHGASAASDASGKLRFTDLPHGRYTLEVADIVNSNLAGGVLQNNLTLGSSGSSNKVLNVGDQELNLEATFTEGVLFSGELRDWNTHDPVVGAKIQNSPSDIWPKGVTREDGTFFLPLLPGDHHIWVTAPEGSDLVSGYWNGNHYPVTSQAQQFVTVEHGGFIDPASLDFYLERGGAIEGRILGSDGQPAVGTTVTAGHGTSARTNENGEYRLTNVQPAFVKVHVQPADPHHVAGYITNDGSVTTDYGTGRDLNVSSGVTIRDVNAQLTLGGAIHGSITGLPPEANIHIDVWDGDMYLGSQQRQGSGTFELNNLPPGPATLKVLVYGLPDGYENGVIDDVDVTVVAGQTAQVDMPAGPGGAIRGQLLDSAGNPVTEGRVHFEKHSGSSALDNSGHFEIDGLKSGTYKLVYASAVASRYLQGAHRVTFGETLDIGAVTFAGGASLTVSVKDSDGQPIPGAFVRISQQSGAEYHQANTNDAGQVVFADIPADTYSAWISASGYVNLNEGGIVVSDHSSTFEATLQTASRVTITALSNSMPLANKDLQLRGVPGRTYRAQSDDAGRVTFNAEPGRYQLVAESLFGPNVESDLIEIGQGQTSLTVDLGPTYSLNVTVLEPGNLPAAYARVKLFRDNMQSEYLAETNHDGNVQFDFLPAETYVVAAFLDGRWVYYNGADQAEFATPIVLNDDKPHQRIWLGHDFYGQTKVWGVLRTPDGSSIRGERVHFRSWDSGLTASEETNITDDYGGFLFHVSGSGEFTISAGTDDRSAYLPVSQTDTLAGDETEKIIELTTALGETLEGTVLSGTPSDPTGATETQPVEGARVLWYSTPRRLATTGPDGRFVIRGLSPEMLSAFGNVAANDDLHPITNIPDKDSLNVVLQLIGAAEGTVAVSGALTTHPVLVQLAGLDQPDVIRSEWLQVGAQPQRVRIGYLPPGTYRMTVSSEGLQTITREVTVVAGEAADLGANVLGTPTQVAGKVTVGGVPLAGAALQLKSGEMIVGTADSGTDGTYSFTGLQPGNYDIVAQWDGQDIASANVSLSAGNPQVVDLEADTNVITSLLRYRVVEEPAGAGLPFRGDVIAGGYRNEGHIGQFVNVLDGNVEVRLDSDSRFFDSKVLPDGTTVDPAADGHFEFTAGQSYIDLTIRAERSATLRGTIRDPQGLPVPEATVKVGTTSVTTGGDGRYELPEITSRNVTVTVSKDGAVASETVSNLSAAEVRTVDMTLASLGVLEVTVTDVNGEPVEGAQIHIHTQDMTAQEWAVTGGDGVATLEVPTTEPVQIHVSKDGMIDSYWGDTGSGPGQIAVGPGESKAVGHVLRAWTTVMIDASIEGGPYPGEMIAIDLLDPATGKVIDSGEMEAGAEPAVFEQVPPGTYLVRLSSEHLPTYYLTATGVTTAQDQAEALSVTGDGTDITRRVTLARQWVDASVEMETLPANLVYGQTPTLRFTVTAPEGATVASAPYTLVIDHDEIHTGTATFGEEVRLVLPIFRVGTHRIVLSTEAAGNVRENQTQLDMVITKMTPELTLSAPPTTFGDPVKVTVSAADTMENGALLDDAPVIITLDGLQLWAFLGDVETVEFKSPPAGTHQVTATLAASGNYHAASAETTVTVRPYPVTITAQPGATQYEYADTIAINYTIDAGAHTPRGRVFLQTPQGQVLAEANASTGAPLEVPAATIGAGEHTLTVRYEGYESLTPAQTDVNVSINGAATQTQILNAPATVRTGDPFNVTVQVTGPQPTPSGTVAVEIAGERFTAELNNGKATVPINRSLPVGEQHIVARYLGAGSHLGSNSAPRTITVTKTTSTVEVTPPANSTYGTQASATVTVRGAGGTPATGTVRLTLDGEYLGEASLAGGAATIALPSDAALGSHQLVATYSGSDLLEGATSPVARWTVLPGAPRVTATASSTLLPIAPGSDGAELSLTTVIDATPGTPVKYTIWWGDGTVTPATPYTGEFTLTHTYARPGTYTIRVQADGSYDGHTLIHTQGIKVVAFADEDLVAVAGDAVQVVAGDAAYFDATASRPAPVIDRVEWAFSDGGTASGWQVSHVFAEAGDHWATVTVYRGDASASATVPVTVAPISVSGGVEISVTSAGANVQGAQVAYANPGGGTISALSDAGGVATLHGLPDGDLVLSVWANGFVPTTVPVTVTSGAGRASVALSSGDVASTVLEHKPMTAEEIAEAGIDAEAVANKNVYVAEVQLSFVPEGSQPQDPIYTVVYSVDPEAEDPQPSIHLVNCDGECGTGGTGGVPIHPSITVINGQTALQWLFVPIHTSWLKEMFEVKLVVTNLAPAGSGFDFTGGSATLSLPEGLSLASMVGAPQTLTVDIDDVPASQSTTAVWYVRGDTKGDYYDVSATYGASVEPVGVPLSMEARIANPIRVWGEDALKATVIAEPTAVARMPYRVVLEIQNVTPANGLGTTVNNLRFGFGGGSGFVYYPGQKLGGQVPKLGPGEYTRIVAVLSPHLTYKGSVFDRWLLQVADSAVVHTSGNVDLHATVVAGLPSGVNPLRIPLKSAVTAGSGVDTVDVTWDSFEGATGYTVYSRDSVEVADMEAWRPIASTSGDTSVTLDEATPGLGRYLTIVAETPDGPVPSYELVSITPGTVALGDGFSSGEGQAPFVEGTDTDRQVAANAGGGASFPDSLYAHLTGGTANMCHRSVSGAYLNHMYDDTWVADLGKVSNAACSGASAGAVESAQLDAVDDFTEVITLTAGGNDLNLTALARACTSGSELCSGAAAQAFAGGNLSGWMETALNAEHVATLQAAQALQGGSSVAQAIASCGNSTDCVAAVVNLAAYAEGNNAGKAVELANLYNGAVTARLTSTYTALMNRAPNATIYVGTYPRYFSEETLGAGPGVERQCAVGGAPLSQGYRVALNGIVDELNNAILRAAAEANASRSDGGSIEVVDVNPYFSGKELCVDGQANGTSAIAAIGNVGGTWADAYDAVTAGFHPNAAGQQLYAKAFTDAIETGRVADFEILTSEVSERTFDVAVPTRLIRAKVQSDAPQRLGLQLVAPDGTVYSADNGNATLTQGDGYATISVASPGEGTWTLRTVPSRGRGALNPTMGEGLTRGTPVRAVASIDLLSHQASAPNARGTVTAAGQDGQYIFDATGSSAGGTYVWAFSDGTSATGATVEHTFADGADIAATLTVADAGGLRSHVDVRLVPESVTLLMVDEPVVTGTATVGEVLSVNAGQWYPAPERVTFQWLRDGQPIAGETNATYTVTAADLGAALSVRVTAVKPGYLNGEFVTPELRVEAVPLNIANLQHPDTMAYGEHEFVTVTVTRSGQPVVGASVELRSGTVVLAQTESDESGLARFDLKTLPVGTHTLSVHASADGLQAASDPFEVEVTAVQSRTTLTAEKDMYLNGEQIPLNVSVSGRNIAAGDHITVVALPAQPGDPERVLHTATLTEADMVVAEENAGASANVSVTVDTTDLGIGTHSLVARYAGNTQVVGSESAQLNLVVAQPTRLEATVAEVESGAERQVDIRIVTELIAGAPVAGRVVVNSEAWTEPVSADVTDGTATVRLPGRGVGTETLTVDYSGSGPYAPATVEVESRVRAAQTAATLDVSPAASIYGDTLTAQIEVSTTANVAVSGRVDVYAADGDGQPTGQALGGDQLTGGAATVILPRQAAGEHSFVAVFTPDTTELAASTSPAVSVRVESRGADVTIAVVSDAVTIGTAIEGTVTATALGAHVPGTVTVTCGDVTVNAQETVGGWEFAVPTGAMAAGSCDVTAVLSPTDPSISGGQASVPVRIDKADAALTATLSHQQVVVGQTPVTMSISQPSTPGEVVTVSWGTEPAEKAEVTLDDQGQAEFELPALPVGTHTITVSYAGSAVVAAASVEQTLTVDLRPGSIHATAAPGRYGLDVPTVEVDFVGLADQTRPSGTVTLRIGDRQLATHTLTELPAQITLPQLDVGTHQVSVTYSGDAEFASSETTVDVVVTPTPVTVNVDWPAQVTVGAAETIDFAIAVDGVAGPGLSLPAIEGSVDLVVDGVVVDSAAAPSGSLALPDTLSVGAHRVEVIYRGAASVAEASIAETITVATAQTTLTVTGPNEATFGQVPELTVDLSGPDGPIAGTVTVTVGDRVLTTVEVPAAGATVPVDTRLIGAGVHDVHVAYAGTDHFAPSAETHTLTVAKATPTIAVSTRASSLPQSLMAFDVELAAPGVSIDGTVTATSANGPTLTATVSNGRATVLVPRTIADGTYTYTVRYEGTENIAPVEAAASQFSVNRVKGSISIGPIKITVSATVVKIGGKIRVTLEGLVPGDVLHFFLYSDPVFVGTTTVAADGTAQLDIDVPGGLAPGEHRIEVRGLHGVISTWITVLAPDSPGGGGGGGGGTPGTPGHGGHGTGPGQNQPGATTTVVPARRAQGIAKTGPSLAEDKVLVPMAGLFLLGAALVVGARRRRRHGGDGANLD